MSLLFGYQESTTDGDDVDTKELEKSVSALKSTLATNNTKTNSLETKVENMKSAVSFATGNLATIQTDIANIKTTNSTQHTSIQNNWVKGITNEGSITWARNKANSNATNITQLAGRVTLVEGRKKYTTTFFSIKD